MAEKGGRFSANGGADGLPPVAGDCRRRSPCRPRSVRQAGRKSPLTALPSCVVCGSLPDAFQKARSELAKAQLLPCKRPAFATRKHCFGLAKAQRLERRKTAPHFSFHIPHPSISHSSFLHFTFLIPPFHIPHPPISHFLISHFTFHIQEECPSD